MDKQEAKERIEKLKESIRHYRYLYHVLDRQEISDAALGSLKKERFDLEQGYPEFVTSDSPTQRVGGKPIDKFVKVRHKEQMLSFNDTFSEQDMTDWQERISKLLSEKDQKLIDFYCELKIDGLAIELVYRENVLQIGSTRGDGMIGEDVTMNLKTIDAIPLKIRTLDDFSETEKSAVDWVRFQDKELIVRGEVFVPKKEFLRLNKEQEKKSLPLFANPRNMAAGSIRQLDPKITVQRGLDFTAYDLVGEYGQEGHDQEHNLLKLFGFKTSPHTKHCKNLKEVFEFYNYWRENREKLPYEIDGIVVVVNQNRIYEELGVVGKAPRGAVAFKFPLKQATTIVEKIVIQVGRTGALTPVAILKPVEIGGVKISRATLHNEDEIKKLGVKIGDTVIVGRAGDVIPDIVKVLPELRTGKEKGFHFPEFCPACNKKIFKKKDEAVWRCSNRQCFNRQRKNLYHFTSRGAFNIVGLGPRILDKLLDAGLVADAADLFKLEVGDIIHLKNLPSGKTRVDAKIQGFAEKSANNLIRSVASKKRIGLARFIYSLGIRNVGEETARDLALYLGSLNKLKVASFEDLQKILDIGPIAADSIYQYFKDPKNREFLDRLNRLGVEIVSEKGIRNTFLEGKNFALTGILDSITRNAAKERIRFLGGKVSESVSRNTSYVVAGTHPGSKLDAAKRLNIQVLNETEFIKMLDIKDKNKQGL